MLEVLWTLMATAAACSVLGPFLVLRGLSMTADALSHSVLLGIVVAFMFVGDLESVWLIIGAAAFGLLTVLLVELLSEKRLVKRDDALGIVFPMFFAAAVILITKLFRNVHLDVDIVLMGNPLFAPFIRLWGLPKSMVLMLIMLAVNGAFIACNYRALKYVAFDPEFSVMQGIPAKWLYRAFMALTSITCVLAFDSVGAILVVSLFVAPAAAACALTKDLKSTLLVSVLFGIVNSALGYFMGVRWNVSISGMSNVFGLLTCLLVVLLQKRGAVRSLLERERNRRQFSEDLILIHIHHHKRNRIELGFSSIHQHLNWSDAVADRRIQKLIGLGLVCRDEGRGLYALTAQGLARVRSLLSSRPTE